MWFLFGRHLGGSMAGIKMSTANHILSYAQSLRGGGVERALLRFAREWADAGRRVTLVIGDPAGPLLRELPDNVVMVTLGSAEYRTMAALPGLVRKLRPDVIFCPGSHYTGVAAWTRARLGRQCPPIVGKISNALTRKDYGPLVRRGHAVWLRLHPRFLNQVVAMTPASAEAAVAAMRLPRSRIAIIPNPPARPIAGIPPLDLPARYILGVGRLERQKRWDRLIAAVAELRDPAVPLVILGEGAERPALAALADALGIGGRLLMPGYVADPLTAMAGAALVALTSDYEGVPNVLREALSVGTPVVTTDSSPAVAEIVTTPALGSIVPSNDRGALVAALDHWMGGAPRPRPVMPPGADAALDYLRLFDSLMPT